MNFSQGIFYALFRSFCLNGFPHSRITLVLTDLEFLAIHYPKFWVMSSLCML